MIVDYNTSLNELDGLTRRKSVCVTIANVMFALLSVLVFVLIGGTLVAL